MARGMIVFGAPGSGTTTIGRELARRIGFFHIDLDDHHWRWDTPLPYTVFRTREERIRSLTDAVAQHPHFVMSGSMWSIRKSFEPLFDLAVFNLVPAEIRAERLRIREFARWGGRVLPGGDLYEANAAHRDYLAAALRYDFGNPPELCKKQHEQWAAELSCPVLRVDGTRELSVNAEWIAARYRSIMPAK